MSSKTWMVVVVDERMRLAQIEQGFVEQIDHAAVTAALVVGSAAHEGIQPGDGLLGLVAGENALLILVLGRERTIEQAGEVAAGCGEIGGQAFDAWGQQINLSRGLRIRWRHMGTGVGALR